MCRKPCYNDYSMGNCWIHICMNHAQCLSVFHNVAFFLKAVDEEWYQATVVEIIQLCVSSFLQIFDFALTAEEMESIRSIDKNVRALLPTVERNG